MSQDQTKIYRNSLVCKAEENSGRKVRVHENRKILFGGTTVPISLLLYTIVLYSRTTYVVVHRVGYSATSTLPRLCVVHCAVGGFASEQRYGGR